MSNGAARGASKEQPMDHLAGKFVWFEHVCADTQKARAFYQPLFGWHVESMPMGERSYPMILQGQQGIGGLREAEAGEPAHWASYLSVQDVDASFRAAVAAGATPLQGPVDFGPVGRGAALRDPTGAALWIWTGTQDDRPDPEATPYGDWYWNELWTPDARRALAFYEAVFGYTHQVMDMGEQGDYLVLHSADGRPRAGIFQTTEAQMTPQWLPYVSVADCDATATDALRLGALSVPVAPTDIPGIGRFAVLIDPLGATLAVIKPTPMAA
jgi:predicted enzyme related to lactoylglutathione lyase